MKIMTRSSFKKLFILVSFLGGCTNINEKAFNTVALNPAVSTLVSSSAVTHILKNATSACVLDNRGICTTNLDLSLSVDTATSGFKPLTQYCGSAATNPCQCQLTWSQLNTVGNNSHTVNRTKKMLVTTVQGGLVKCTMTQSFWNEIADGTVIHMNIIPMVASGNLTGLVGQSLSYKKGTQTTSTGDFFDSTLSPFRNIKHYTCYNRRSNAHEILSQIYPADNGASPPVPTNFVFASKFCADPSTSSAECPTPRNGYSAQSYYRNLYVPSNVSVINSHNAVYDCPKVDESIKYSAGDAAQPSGESGKYWPLDSSFALATQNSSEWSVGIRAASVLGKDGGDVDSNPTNCADENLSAALLGKRLQELALPGGTPAIATKCLGYAKLPKADGTCGSISDSNGRVRPMVRLRRYRAIYPPAFKSNGTPLTTALEADEYYAADRLVVNNTGALSGEMIYGPKPCNFAWFDHEGVVNRDTAMVFETHFKDLAGVFKSRPAYVGTNEFYNKSAGLTTSSSVNPDGLILPNLDVDGNPGNPMNPPSCSATMPVVETSMGTPSLVRLVTSHQNRTDSITVGSKVIGLHEVHIRPVDPWTPEYIEDTSLQACVPLSDTFTEPPMHFYSKQNTDGSAYMAWCAKVYPTQNPYWAELNKKRKPQNSVLLTSKLVNYPAAAQVKTRTSHLTGVGTLSIPNNGTSCVGNFNVCTNTSSPAELANCKTFLGEAAPAANYCDRTVRFDSTQDFRTFPLQASSADIVSMLSNDFGHQKNYGCTYSVSSDASKVGKKVPSSGCCGTYLGSKVLAPTAGGATTLFPIDGTAKNGHLEPFVNPAFPNIRFCGNPVQ